MGKKADRYFREDPWQIVEEGFDPVYSRVSESVFSLANEYMGVRGYMEEGITGDSLVGSYFGGVYEQKKQNVSSYKGMIDTTEFMVRSVDWLYTRLKARGEGLDLGKCSFRDFRRTLDMRTGVLARSFVWKLTDGSRLQITLERILSMNRVERAAQRITVTSLDYQGGVELDMGLDGSGLHESARENFWRTLDIKADDWAARLEQETVHTGQRVCTGMRVTGKILARSEAICPVGFAKEEKKVVLRYHLELMPGKTVQIQRRVCNLVWKPLEHTVCGNREQTGGQDYQEKCNRLPELLETGDFEEILEENRKWWQEIWEKCDIEIYGDSANQQGIRFCIFQMFQTYHGAVKGSNIGAKGLTGEAYNGNAFWDTETYCLPFFLFHDQKAAENLLYFRYQTLDEARKRAAQLDCQGAFYPIATISGRECCNLWQHASLQLQASTAVAYGIWFYEKVTGNLEFLKNQGLEMLLEISRMLATRGDFSGDGTRYGYYGVMGPDEFQMMVNHNCYTNYMGRFTFRYTLECIEILKLEAGDTWAALAARLNYRDAEGEEWKQMADAMYIPKNEETKLYEQQEGFFELPHIDVDQIPVEDFPLYNHWTYDRIYRNDMIKQPDVLMLMLLFNNSFTKEELKCNYEYYEPRCIHESSLSPSVHSILASQLGKKKEAYEFFRFATRMDLDNYNRNSGEGIHTTSIAAAWMNIVYGFGGLRSDGDLLQVAPTIPEQWEEYAFRLCYQGDTLTVRVKKNEVQLSMTEGRPVELLVYGEKIRMGKEPVIRSIPEKYEKEADHELDDKGGRL